MVVIQPSGAVATVQHGYAVAGQQPVYIPQQVRLVQRSFTLSFETVPTLKNKRRKGNFIFLENNEEQLVT